MYNYIIIHTYKLLIQSAASLHVFSAFRMPTYSFPQLDTHTLVLTLLTLGAHAQRGLQ